MLTDDEKRKIIEEEELRLRIRQAHYAKQPGCLTYIGRLLVFMFILGMLFTGIMIAISLFSRINNDTADIPPALTFASLGISVLLAGILWSKIFLKKA